MDYFSARNVESVFYENYTLPTYFAEVLDNLDSQARILDFGCGFGQTLYALKTLSEDSYNGGGGNAKNFELMGIDISKKAIEHCQSQGINAQMVENILDFIPTQKFDLILTTHCLEHLPKDSIIPVLKHFKEHCLKENGKIFVAVPNAQSHTGCYWAYEDFTHNTLFTAGSLIYVLKMAGFSDIKIIDPKAIAGSKGLKKILRLMFLKIYMLQYKFWNKITASAFHQPSPIVFSYEIKALAQ